jgi:hypothetical protein
VDATTAVAHTWPGIAQSRRTTRAKARASKAKEGKMVVEKGNQKGNMEAKMEKERKVVERREMESRLCAATVERQVIPLMPAGANQNLSML